MNPFDEFFPSDAGCSENCPLTRDDPEWLIECGCPPARRWRKKWEQVILRAMERAEFLDWFCELGEGNRSLIDECLEEYEEYLGEVEE